jgi:hypothetical protein
MNIKRMIDSLVNRKITNVFVDFSDYRDDLFLIDLLGVLLN